MADFNDDFGPRDLDPSVAPDGRPELVIHDKMPNPPTASMRRWILGVCLGFTLCFSGLTVFVIFEQGLDIFVFVSLIVLAMFAFGLTGALLYKGEDELPPRE